MQPAQQIAPNDTAPAPVDDFVAGILQGFRFRVCQTSEDWEAALEIRRSVYRESCGYEVPIPDEYDGRSWLFIAEDVATGAAVGTMRVTPRYSGPVEAEEYFTLPRHLRQNSAEITRFAIMPGYRKGKTFLPVVSLGLFKLVRDFSARIGIRHLIVCSKAERMWTYEWMRFKTTGKRARYSKLNDAEHELISLDLVRCFEGAEDHPFYGFFRDARYQEVEVPARIPSPGLPFVPDDASHVAIGA